MKEPEFFEDLHHHLIKISEKFAFLFLVILMFDELLDMFLSACGHFYEAIEYSLDVLVEHFLHTSDPESELISFYLMMGLLLCLLLYLYRVFPRLLAHFNKYLHSAWAGYKQRSAKYWHHLSLLEKIELTMTYLLEASFILFWLTM